METSKWNVPRFLIYVLGAQIAFWISLLLDIPIIRQVFGFLFLIFVPGLVLLRLLRIAKLNLPETVLFSVGLSISFLMLIGVLVNELGSFNLIPNPLSTGFLVIIVNVTLTLMCFLSCLMNREDSSFIKLSLKSFWPILASLIIPLLSVIGVLLVNVFNNNLLLITVLIVISIIFVSSMFISKLSSYYPIILFSIALALLLSTTLVSRYMYGSDIGVEFSGFTATKTSSFWNRDNFNNWDQFSSVSMVSVTILPAIFSNLLNLEGVWIFKILFPIIFSFVPLGLYQFYRIYWDKRVAFIAVIFFMANYSFFQTLVTNAKQMIAELFFVLAFLIMLKGIVKHEGSKWIILLFFFFGMIVSHYATTYIFLFIILSTLLLGKIVSKKRIIKIKSTIIASALCITFLWYLYVVHGPFEKLVDVIRSTFESLATELFLSTSRGDPVQLALGLLESSTALHNFGRIIFNIAMVLILVGFIYSLIEWKKGKIDSEIGLIIFLNIGLLGLAIILPRFAGFLQMSRLHHFALLFLSPLFVLGAIFLLIYIPNLIKGNKSLNLKNEKKKSYCFLLISIVLVPFFFFQTGLVYEVAEDPFPSSISLSKRKLADSTDLIPENDVFSAVWLNSYGDVERMLTYADTLALLRVLTSYSTIHRSLISVISNTTERTLYPGIFSDTIKDVENPSISYVYMRKFNVEKGMVLYYVSEGIYFNVTDLPLFNTTDVFMNRVYSNGASEIYYRAPQN